ncbi:MAG: tetratricopeptide repeat protein [Patescibacteria group bacterium]|nr:tetratricopeptide repeat protein [Patescibacteria group bacterium]MDE2588449.1 tetratricopeptide repeat protein [Patescibacteria group bacterium]
MTFATNACTIFQISKPIKHLPMTDIQQAIHATLQGNWEQAITLNLELLKQNPKDVESLNRLAFAYSALGKNKEAKETYEKVLAIDELNTIALRNLKRLEGLGKKSTPQVFHLDNSMFLEEVGKTKVITLVNPAPSKLLRRLQMGQPVILHIKRSKIFVLDETKEFLGMLPDNISHRLIKFMDGGNQYEAYIRAADEHTASVFVRETKRATKYKHQPSFVTFETAKQSVVPKHKAQDLEEEETSEE